MRVVLQRVREASIEVDGDAVAEIGAGVVVLLGVAPGDAEAESERIAGKVARLRIFDDENGRFDRTLVDVEGEALVVSQFTLLADTRKGNRPSFTHAAPAELAEPLYEHFCETLEGEGIRIARGRFGARMQGSLVNDGPVTIVLDA